MKPDRAHLTEIGRKGGLASTPAKRWAAIRNGKRGGRPSKLARLLKINGGLK